jgi:hypothetical protein
MKTVARLSIWLYKNDRDAFTDAFARRLLPLLKRYDLESPVLPEKKTVAGVFSQLFIKKSPAEIFAVRQALLKDNMWKQTLRSMGIGSNDPSADLGWRFEVRQTPAIPERIENIGPGARDGLWHRFRCADGLATQSGISQIHRDRQGHLWFCDQHLLRFDGNQLQHFNPSINATKRGLIKQMLTPAQDGGLWIGGDKICHYDGHHFTYYTEADGLSSEPVMCLSEDRRGRLWVGTSNELMRYEAGTWSSISLSDTGQPTPITCLAEDGQGGMWIGSLGCLYHFGSQGPFATYSHAEAVAKAAKDVLIGEMPSAVENPSADHLPTLVEAEKKLILRALERTQGTVGGKRGAASLLDINPHTLRSRMKKHGIVFSRKK